MQSARFWSKQQQIQCNLTKVLIPWQVVCFHGSCAERERIRREVTGVVTGHYLALSDSFFEANFLHMQSLCLFTDNHACLIFSACIRF